jgi:hypothetical protein
VLPVLVLAIVFEYRAMTGSGPNVYKAFGLPVKMTAPTPWFSCSYVVVLVLMPASLFAAETAALRVKGVKTPFRRSGVDSAVSSGPSRPRGGFGTVWFCLGIHSRLGLGATSLLVSRARANTRHR